MPENEAKEIETRNQKYLEELQGNIGKYLSFLSTMARFHKYEVKDLASFALEAPAIYKAVADEEIWQKHFKRKKSKNARGIKLVRDGKIKIFYDVSETESTIKNEVAASLWKYDESEHKKFIDAVVADEKDIEKQIHLIAQELIKRRNISEESKNLVALSVEAVILERMGLPTEKATRQLAQLSLKDQNITPVLEETQKTARIFLDAMQLTIKENDKGNENNLLLKEIGTIKVEKEIAKTPEARIETPKEISVSQKILEEDMEEIQSKPELTVTEDAPKENFELENGSEVENVVAEKIEIGDEVQNEEEVTKITESQVESSKETLVQQEIFEEDAVEIQSKQELKVAENAPEENLESENGSEVENVVVGKIEIGDQVQNEEEVTKITESQVESFKETPVKQEIFEEDAVEIQSKKELKVAEDTSEENLELATGEKAENVAAEKVEIGDEVKTEEEVAEIPESQFESLKETLVKQEIFEEDTAEIPIKQELKVAENTPKENFESSTGAKVENLEVEESEVGDKVQTEAGVTKAPESQVESQKKPKENFVQQSLFGDDTEKNPSEDKSKIAEDTSKESSEKTNEPLDLTEFFQTTEEISEKADLEKTLVEKVAEVSEIQSEENDADIIENAEVENIGDVDENQIENVASVPKVEVIEENIESVELADTEIFEEMGDRNSDYNFEEIDEEPEVIIDVESDIKTADEVQESETPVGDIESDKNSTPDLQTIIAEDMAVIRGDNREKNVFRKNVVAIRTLQNIEKERREATPEEIEILKDYAGFGGIPKAFDKNNPNWHREAWLLASMLKEKEYESARSSTLNAHYTSDEIIQNMYEGLKNLGFHNGTILEPSMGVGGFFGNMPEEMKEGSHLYGVELDSITGRIAKAIYSDAEISVKGFEETKYLNDSFDIALGNVPFGNYYVNDTGYNSHRFFIHDYFIAKMIDQVRPGGLVAVITSKGTLDKQDKRARKYFAQRADLVKAIRLPNNAFKNAGTEVTSDILIFKKLENIRSEEELPNWINVTPFQDEKNITINPYFIEHPEDVLGTLEKTSTAYGFDLTCKPDENHPLNDTLSERMKSLPQIYLPNAVHLSLPQQITDVVDTRPSSYFIENGEIKFYDGFKNENVKINAKDRDRMLLAMKIRDYVRKVLDVQVNDGIDIQLEVAQGKLNHIYEKYVHRYGHICEDTALKKIFSKDSAYPLLRSLEVYGKEGYKGKSPIFSQRMIEPHRSPVYAENPVDALAISMQEFGRVSLDYMTALTGQSEEEVIKALEFERIYFDFQKKEYQIAEEFLSGDVREKMDQTQIQIQEIENEINAKIAESILNIGEIPKYEPQNEIEKSILQFEINGNRYFSFSNYLDENKNPYYVNYIESQQDNRAFMLQVALRQGKYMDNDSVSKILSDKPLLSLDAMRFGKELGDIRDSDIVVVISLRALGERFRRDDPEHDLILYSFLKERFSKLDGNADAIQEEITNLNYRDGIDEIREKWEKYKAEYQDLKNAKKIEITPEIENLRAIKSRLEKNFSALDNVKPQDLTAADIHVEIGATWIPPEDIRRFIQETFDVSSSGMQVHFSNITGTWRIEGKSHSTNPKIDITYGIEQMNALALTELALNMKEPKIYKTVYIDNVEKKIVDQEPTIAAQQKQEMIKQEFTKWIFADETRRDRLVAYYNRHFNKYSSA